MLMLLSFVKSLVQQDPEQRGVFFRLAQLAGGGCGMSQNDMIMSHHMYSVGSWSEGGESKQPSLPTDRENLGLPLARLGEHLLRSGVSQHKQKRREGPLVEGSSEVLLWHSEQLFHDSDTSSGGPL